LATFGHAQLPDTRLKVRLVDVAIAWAGRPHDTIPQACGKWGRTKGAYRFLENPRVTCDALIASAGDATAKACQGLTTVLAVQDTTTISYNHLVGTKDLGPTNDQETSRGLLLHSTLALRLDGRPIGLLHQKVWCRKEEERGSAKKRRELPIEEKESFKWLDGIFGARERLNAQVLESRRPRLIHIMDREGDIHEVLQTVAESSDGLIVRFERNRRIDDPCEYARPAIQATPVLGTATIEVPRTHEKPARKALVEVRSRPLDIVPNPKRDPRRRPFTMTLVEIREVAPPEGAEPLQWLLWTTEPATTLEQALAVAELYGKRWRIEDLHFVLKSGCAVEKLQLETAERLAKAVVLYSSIAARIVQLRDWAREAPETPCTEVLQQGEWRALWTTIHKQPPASEQVPPTIREAVLWIGRLGGHLNRKGDGLPGVRTLWRGWRDLMMLTDLYVVLRPPQ
jgi:hypothetical protein